MRTETFDGVVETYQNKAVNPPIKYSGSVEVYENVAEARSSENWPGDSEVLKMVNNKLLTAAKASKYQENTAQLKKDYEASDDFKRAGLIKAAVAAGFSQQEAEALAASKLG